MRLLFWIVPFLFAFASVSSFAQVLDIAQSSPDLTWHSISNDSVKVIYPDYLQAESVYIANLVEHYSKFVGQTYGISKPKQFDLIIRSEMAQPNGYVTLAPRRSEWFASSMFFPYVGSTEWYQTLSIHEYRHVNQFDYFNRETTKVLYVLMGDMGELLAMGLTVPSWYMEGDAVWAETKYTDGGRGRSPRFISRLKALVLSDKIPTYDQFLSGSYQTELPNQYVYGYALISYGVQKYGEDLWPLVMEDIARFPVPLRFYWSFERVTKQSFKDFYNEAMNDLKTKWAADKSQGEKEEDYRDLAVPYKVGDSLYYVKYDLDSHVALMKETNGKSEVVRNISFNKEFMELNVGKTKAVYTEFLPDRRYGQKGTSELVVLDLKSGSKDRITSGARLYNPNLNATETKILVTDFRPDQSWNISEYDLNGKLLQTFALPDMKVAEARYMDDTTAIALVGSKTGLKSIVMVDLVNHKITKQIVAPSRNLISSLSVDAQKNLFFEAQYKGVNDIFKIDGKGLARCTNTKLGAHTPSSDGENLYFSQMDTYGALIAKTPVSSCTAMAATELVDFNYLGNTASDNYNRFQRQEFPEQESLYTKNADQYKSEAYGDFDTRLFIPHTWGLMLGRGGGLGVQTDNYLRTLSLGAAIGVDPEEGQSVASLSFDVKKYYPLFKFEVETREREVKDFETEDRANWKENSAGLTMVLPYIKRSGIYNFLGTLTVGGNYTDASDYEFNDANLPTTNYFYKSMGAIGLAWSQDGTPRSIQAPWLLSYAARFDNAEQPSDATASGSRTFQEAILQTPGVFNHDGFRFVFDQQKQDDSANAYRFLPVGASAISYVFSRGYEYEDVPGYQKLSGNYTFPIGYPDFNWSGWYYLKRAYGNLFFDSTYIQDTELDPTLNSYGAELLLESKIMRFLPLTLGFRVLQTLQDNVVKGEVFLATDVGF